MWPSEADCCGVESFLVVLSNIEEWARHLPGRAARAHRRRERAMEYALLIYGDEKVWTAREGAAAEEHTARHMRFAAKLQERGALRGGEKLALPGAATTLRRNAGGGDSVSVTDGPFAETAEVFGGFYIIEAADLDEAIAVARELPEDVVEIRPVESMRARS
jgi:hypothetical protein